MGNVYIRGRITETGGLEAVDPELVAIIYAAAERSPYDVEIFSGYRPNAPDSQHGARLALDIALLNPATGEPIPNLAAGGETFLIYEQFARLAREEQLRLAPDRSDDFRWGGYFGPSRLNPRGADLMHFDFEPDPDRGMGRGAWGGGLNQVGIDAVAELGPGFYYNWQQYDVPAPEGVEWPNLWDTQRLVLHPAEENAPLRVMMLQMFLNSQGAGLRLTGDFDEATEAAVRAFQETAGIPQHGVVGTETIQSMLDTWQQPSPTPNPNRPGPPPIPTPNPLRAGQSAFQPGTGFGAPSPGFAVQPVVARAAAAGQASPDFYAMLNTGLAPPSSNYASAMGAKNYRPPAPPPLNYAEAMAAQAYRPAPTAPPLSYPEFITGLQSPKLPRGLLDVEAMEEEERNAAKMAAATAAAMRNAPSAPKRFVDPAEDEDEDDEPRDSDPVDVWMKKRRKQVGSGPSTSAYPTTSTSSSKSKSSAQQTTSASKKPTASATKPSTSTTKKPSSTKLIVA